MKTLHLLGFRPSNPPRDGSTWIATPHRNPPLLPVILLGSLLVFGCNKPSEGHSNEQADTHDEHADEHGHGNPSAEVELPKTLTVDPSLVESGRISLVTAQRETSASGRRVPGEVVSATDGAAQISALVGGRIASLEANVGDRVEKNETLAWVESPEVGAARADLTTASAELQLEQARYDRQRSLQSENATSQAAVDAAHAALKSAEATRVAAMLRLSALGASGGNGARYALTSPIEGVVTERNAILGAAVHPGSVLFSVIAPGRILVVARYPEGGTGIPEEGTPVRLIPRGGDPSRACNATVETNSRVVDPHTRTVLVRLKPDESCRTLRPGSYVEVHSIDTVDAVGETPSPTPAGDAISAVRVPEEAVVFIRDRSYVFVADETPGLFHARWVRAQFPNDGTATVSEGLRAGERIVERGTILLKGEMLQEVLGGHEH